MSIDRSRPPVDHRTPITADPDAASELPDPPQATTTVNSMTAQEPAAEPTNRADQSVETTLLDIKPNLDDPAERAIIARGLRGHMRIGFHPQLKLNPEEVTQILAHRAELAEQARLQHLFAMAQQEADLQAAAAAEHERQVAIAAAEQLEADAAQLERDIVEAYRVHRRQVGTASSAYWNAKGSGGCTTTATNDATVMSLMTNITTTVFDANPASGTCAARLGFKSNGTLTAQGLSDQLSRLRTQNYVDFSPLAPRNGDFLRVIASHPLLEVEDDAGSLAASAQAGSHSFTPVPDGASQPAPNGPTTKPSDTSSTKDPDPLQDPQLLVDMLKFAQDNDDALVVDTTNQVNSPAALAVVGQTDIGVYTAFVGERDSLRKLAETMAIHRQAGFAKKVENGVVCITGIKDGQSLDEFRKYLNLIDFDGSVVAEYTWFKGAFVGIRFDEVIARNEIVDWRAWDPRTRRDYCVLGLARFRQILLLRDEVLPEITNPTLLELLKTVEPKPSAASIVDVNKHHAPTAGDVLITSSDETVDQAPTTIRRDSSDSNNTIDPATVGPLPEVSKEMVGSAA
jgi:hypothetical protein